MPPSAGTTAPTQIRIPPELKKAAKARAARQGKTLTDVVLAALREYTKSEVIGTITITPHPAHRHAVMKAAGLKCRVPGCCKEDGA